MNSEDDFDWNSREKHSIPMNNEDVSPQKRSRPTNSHPTDFNHHPSDDDDDDDEPYSPSQQDFHQNQQKLIRQAKFPLKESTLIPTGQKSSTAILQLLQDDDDDEDEVCLIFDFNDNQLISYVSGRSL